MSDADVLMPDFVGGSESQGPTSEGWNARLTARWQNSKTCKRI